MEGSHDSFSDRRERSRARRAHEPEPEEQLSSADEPEMFDAENLLPGAVLMVPNRHWGFHAESAADHPGACAYYQPGANDAVLVKGTDADHVRNPRRYFVVEATEQNGLKKRTAFELTPRTFRLHRIKLLFAERYLGRLEQPVLEALRAELARRGRVT